MLRLLPSIVVVILQFLHVFPFDLSDYGIESSYYVASIAILTNRAYLALPRSSCYNNVTSPTLVEAPWPPEHTSSLWNKKMPFFIGDQDWGTCEHLQDVVSVDAEPIRHRLWVLDKGNENCSAKVAIYNIFQKINYTIDLPNDISNEFLSNLVVDPFFGAVGTRAYVGLRESDYLLIFSFNEFKWWKIKLETSNSDTFPVSSQFLALSRREFALFVTGGQERGLFSLDLAQIRKDLDDDFISVNATFLGEKLGNSSGLVTDLKEGLIYYLPNDYAIVRWDTRYPSIAEHYSVLGQSYDILPSVSDLFTGPQNGIWALINPGSDCAPTETPTKRVIKLLKYNIII